MTVNELKTICDSSDTPPSSVLEENCRVKYVVLVNASGLRQKYEPGESHHPQSPPLPHFLTFLPPLHRPLSLCPSPSFLPLLPLLFLPPSFIWPKLNVLCEITSQQEIPPVLPDCSVFSPGLATMCVLHKCLCSAQDLHSSPVSPVKRPAGETQRRAPSSTPEPQQLAGGIKTMKVCSYRTVSYLKSLQPRESTLQICVSTN